MTGTGKNWDQKFYIGKKTIEPTPLFSSYQLQYIEVTKRLEVKD